MKHLARNVCMILNNWICRNFDTEKNGHVTIGDIFGKIGNILIKPIQYLVAFILMFFFGGLFGNLVTGNKLTVDTYGAASLFNFLRWVIDGWIPIFYFFVIVILIAGVCYLLYKLCQIKIAKCERKEDEK